MQSTDRRRNSKKVVFPQADHPSNVLFIPLVIPQHLTRVRATFFPFPFFRLPPFAIAGKCYNCFAVYVRYNLRFAACRDRPSCSVQPCLFAHLLAGVSVCLYASISGSVRLLTCLYLRQCRPACLPACVIVLIDDT